MEKLTKIMWNQKPKFTERSRTVLGKRQSWLFMSMALLFGHASLVSSQTLSSGASGNWTAIATWLTSGTGTITTVSNNATVNGSGSNFSASMIGMGLYNASNVRIGTRTVSSVASATSLTLSGTAGANNNNIAYKYGAVPGNFTVNINHDVVVNQSLAINSPGSYTVNGTLIDAAGGTAYSLTLDGQNATNRGTFTVNGNTTFGGALTVNNNGHLIINSGDTLRVGGTTFTNNCYVTIHEGGVLIVNGNLTNEVNSTNIEVNGSIIVLGNVINKNQGDVYGAGSVTATGTISNGTGSKVFGSSDNCSSGPCSSSGGTTCSYTSSVSGGQTVCNGATPPTLTSNTTALTPAYQWQYFNSTTTTGFRDITNATSSTYTPSSLAQSTSYRLKITAGGCTQYTNGVALTYNAATAPTVSITTPSTTICSGASVTFTATPSNATTPTYQWKVNNVNVATGTTYTTTSLSNGATVTCVMTAAGTCAGNYTSNTLTMTVRALPSISVQPAAATQTICLNGTSAALSVTASGTGITYQWYSNTTASNTGGTLISGATNANYTPATSAAGTKYYYVVVSGTCAPVATSVVSGAVTVHPVITGNTIGNNETVCYNMVPAQIAGTATLSGGSGSYTYQWQSSADNVSFADINGATSDVYTPSALTANTYFRRVVNSGSCSTTSNAVYKQLNTSVTWTGSQSSSWTVAANWCGNAVPTASDAVVINSGALNNPVISGTVTLKDITIGTGASLTLNTGSVLNITGNWTSSGSVTAKDGSTVKFTATTGTQTIAGGTQTFYNLEKTGAGILLIGATSDVTIRRGGLLKIAAGTFNMNNRSVLLKSKVSAANVDSTASLGVVNGLITNSSSFKVERYNVGVRGFRYVAAPVTGVTAKTFKDSVIIAGPTAAGFDAPNTTVATIKSFVEYRNPVWSKCFVSFTSITTPITPGNGYYLFVPAKRTTVFPANEPVSLLMKGTPITGNFTFNVYYTPSASAGWNLVGNPYPSAIDWDNFGAWTKANVDDAIYIWDPTLGSSGSYYAYVFGISSDGRENGSILSSGQGFFVKANAPSPVLKVTENAKVSGTYAKSNFRQAAPSYVTLKVSNQNGDVDFTTVRLNDETGRSFSAVKMYNSKINMYSKKVSGTEGYSINAIEDAPAFEVPVYLESTTSTVYNVEVVKVVGNINADGKLKIKDAATGTLIDVVQGAKFSLVPNATTLRFSLVKEAALEHVTAKLANDEETDGEYQLYPTHIHGHQHPVLYMHNHHDKKIEVFNSSGEKLATHHTHHSHYAFHDFDKYHNGVYLIKVTSDHKTHTFKIMK